MAETSMYIMTGKPVTVRRKYGLSQSDYSWPGVGDQLMFRRFNSNSLTDSSAKDVDCIDQSIVAYGDN